MISTRKFPSYLRLALDLPQFLRSPMSERQARAMIAARLQSRGQMLIDLLQKAVFSRPASTYARLFRAANLEPYKVSGMIRELGVESALARFNEAGVFLTFEEFKGRSPIERHGITIPRQEIDLGNPLAPGHILTQSGGSTGPGLRLLLDLEHRHLQSANLYLARQAQNLIGVTGCIWRPAMPAASGVSTLLGWIKIGNRIDRWYAPELAQDYELPLSTRLFSAVLPLMGRLAGVDLPGPTPLSLDQADVIARWCAETVAREGAAFVGVSSSMALRIGIAAQEQDISLHGVTFSGGGEASTQAKIEQVEATGARLRPSYYLAEAGAVGMHCGQPTEINDQHFFHDSFALRTKNKRIDRLGQDVDAFQITALLPSAPRLMINVETDDYGIVEKRDCGCLLGEIGLTTHLRRIQSYEKLTGEGMSLVGTDMLHVLHEVLPAKFGGSALDYQLEERPDQRGFTRMVLRVSPSLELPSEENVIEAVLAGLSQIDEGSRLAGAIWGQAGSFTVERAEPRWTQAGKLPALIHGDDGEPRSRTSSSTSTDSNRTEKGE